MAKLLSGWVLAALATAVPVFAGEYAVLSNGFRLHAERHEIAGSNILLYTNGGVTEMPAASVASFEAEEYAAPPAIPPQVDPPLPVRDARTLAAH